MGQNFKGALLQPTNSGFNAKSTASKVIKGIDLKADAQTKATIHIFTVGAHAEKDHISRYAITCFHGFDKKDFCY